MSELSRSSEQRAQRGDFLGSVAVAAAVVGMVVGVWLLRRLEGRPSEDQCEALLEQQLAHATRARRPDAAPEAIDALVREASKRPEWAAELADCRASLTPGQVECGLQSPNVNELERCTQ